MARKVVYDAKDKAQVDAAEKDAEDREKDLQWILSSPRGRRWIYDLIHHTCHTASLSFCQEGTHSTAFNEGARSVGEALLEEVRSRHFAAFIKMMEEHHAPE